jgi:hypothetical protein
VRIDLNYPGLPKPPTEKMLMIEVLVLFGTDAGGILARGTVKCRAYR